METTIGVTVHFDAAHYLPNYAGKCSNMHGHTWRVEVEVTGEKDSITGFVMDLTLLKKIASQAIESFDHQQLNQFISMPTCENLAHNIASYVYTHTRRMNLKNMGMKNPATISKVVVVIQEGGGGWARVELNAHPGSEPIM